MNPDSNRSGMTVNSLIFTGMLASTGIPALLFILLGIFIFVTLKTGEAQTLELAVLGCAIVSVLLVFTINYSVQRRIKDRFLGLNDVCRDYVAGDHNARAMVVGNDEFALMSNSINEVFNFQRGGSSTANAVSSDAATLQAQIEKLLQEVSAVGDGDLRVQAEVTPDTLGVLADSFNYMIEELAKVVGRVQTTAVQVTNATRRILDRSEDLAQASETQVAQISQTTQAVEALAVFIQNVAKNANTSVEVAQEALSSANSGQQSVRQTIEGMMVIRENVQETSKKIKRLGERSNEIGEIVRIIEDIADQTNLLALNAAIQSAMAGEHGRGFAVVADEIRLLSERSTESTKRIATLVKSIQGDTYDAVVAMENSTQEVVKGSQLADEAGRSLNSIYSAVERQAKMIESIARSAQEQTPVSEAVATTMSQISDIIRQTDVGTQEAAVSVTYLSELSEQLRSSVSTFRLPERGNDNANTFITEMQGNNGQMYATPALNAGMMSMDGNDWNQGFSGNFPPLPEPGNSGSLVALSSRNNQYSFDNQQNFGIPGSFGGQQQYSNGSQQGFGFPSSFEGQSDFGDMSFSNSDINDQSFSNPGNDQSFSSQPQYGQFNNQPGFNESQQYGNQPMNGNYFTPDFADMNSFSGFDNRQGFASTNSTNGNGQGNFGSNGNNQPFFPSVGQVPVPQPFNQNGQPSQSSPVSRQRRPSNSQPGPQGQPSPFNQDQVPFSNNGDSGR